MSRLKNSDYRDYGACNVYHLSHTHIFVCRIDRLWIYFALSVWVMVLKMNILCIQFICLQTNKSTIDKIESSKSQMQAFLLESHIFRRQCKIIPRIQLLYLFPRRFRFIYLPKSKFYIHRQDQWHYRSFSLFQWS